MRRLQFSIPEGCKIECVCRKTAIALHKQYL